MSIRQCIAKTRQQVRNIPRLHTGARRGHMGFRDDIRRAVLLGASALLLIFATSGGAGRSGAELDSARAGRHSIDKHRTGGI